MKLKDIREEFADYAKSHENIDLPIYKNPTPKEIADLTKESKYLRFIANNEDKTFWIFPDSLLHDKAGMKLGIDFSRYNTNAIFGAGTYSGGKIKIVEISSKSLTKGHLKKPEKRWLWANKYSNLTDAMNYALKNNTSQIKINEEWLETTKGSRGETVEIFEYPTAKELQDIKGYQGIVRFIADMRKSKPVVYAFPHELMHANAVKKIDPTLDYQKDDPNVIYGQAIVKGSKMHVANLETLNALKRNAKNVLSAKEMLKNTLGNDINKKWGWANIYFENLPQFLEEKYKVE